ncbi:hypothetical protein PAXRUDRAFT_829866 [Paxillus rubicundulus Ve08.2h10]|uniref:Uncharacterized protein n=1 Tax=Paxillus rubicundulus Ve08.2h10 TaxID=930991 RepID=A0A0D0D6S4_9AGAM|nr:hypothetical protein PAXRUDRAFT_829866 [Paxillus rubicundulus Ve08.2h10]
MTKKGDADFVEGTVDLDNWPVHSSAAEEELNNMKNGYHAMPLPAYDTNDQLIDTASYPQWLKGAIVDMHFILSHSAFNGKDTYMADL